MPTALFLHHDANSLIGLLGPAIEAEGYDLREHHICTTLGSGVADRPLPSLDGVDLLVPLGSRWSVHDRDDIATWVDDELELLRAADDRGVPVLGVCFGGQMLAAAHGGTVRAADRPEIGWIEIEPEPAVDLPFSTGPWFQWHLDVFTTPPGERLSPSLPPKPPGPDFHAASSKPRASQPAAGWSVVYFHCGSSAVAGQTAARAALPRPESRRSV